jgi:hypothetical protein
VSPTPSRFADAVRAEGPEHVVGCMTTRLRVLDDGAWLSVDDTRRVSVSELWRLDAPGFCECDLADMVVENFQAVGVDGRTVTARVYGQCIVCGAKSTVEWVPVGRILDGEFVDIDRDGVLSVRRSAPVDVAANEPEKTSG